VSAIWNENPGDALAETLSALWILAALTYFLVPVLQRFTAAGTLPTEIRVLAALDCVELAPRAVPSRAPRSSRPRRANASFYVDAPTRAEPAHLPHIAETTVWVGKLSQEVHQRCQVDNTGSVRGGRRRNLELGT